MTNAFADLRQSFDFLPDAVGGKDICGSCATTCCSWPISYLQNNHQGQLVNCLSVAEPTSIKIHHLSNDRHDSADSDDYRPDLSSHDWEPGFTEPAFENNTPVFSHVQLRDRELKYEDRFRISPGSYPCEPIGCKAILAKQGKPKKHHRLHPHLRTTTIKTQKFSWEQIAKISSPEHREMRYWVQEQPEMQPSLNICLESTKQSKRSHVRDFGMKLSYKHLIRHYKPQPGPNTKQHNKQPALSGVIKARFLSSKSGECSKSRAMPKNRRTMNSTSKAAPISPSSLPVQSREASNPLINFQHQFAVDKEDLSSKPRCQRCCKNKKDCDRQRPCQRCKDAGIGADRCVSEDKDSGRKGSHGRNMGVSFKKSSAPSTISMAPPPAYEQNMAVHGTYVACCCF